MPFENVNIDGLSIFYREAGKETAPKLVLLHGFPASSHQYRNLIPALADRFHVIAPDYPGFGNSDMPDPAHSPTPSTRHPRSSKRFSERSGLRASASMLRTTAVRLDSVSPVGIPSGSNGSSFRTPMPTRSALPRHGTSFAATIGKPAARSRKRQLARFSSPRRLRSSTPRGIPIRS